MQRSDERKDFVKNSFAPSSVCQNQMRQNNNIQPACLNASFNANIQDKYDFSFKYQNVPQGVQSALYALYGMIRQVGYKYNQENIVGINNKEGQIELGAKFSQDLKYFNLSMEAPSFNSRFENVEIKHQIGHHLAHNPVFSQLYLSSKNIFNSRPIGM